MARAEYLMTAGQVAAELGLPEGRKGVAKLAYLIKSGKLPEPEGRIGRKRARTVEEVEAAKAKLRKAK